MSYNSKAYNSKAYEIDLIWEQGSITREEYELFLKEFADSISWTGGDIMTEDDKSMRVETHQTSDIHILMKLINKVRDTKFRIYIVRNFLLEGEFYHIYSMRGDIDYDLFREGDQKILDACQDRDSTQR